jgi:hypothetical protein
MGRLEPPKAAAPRTRSPGRPPLQITCYACGRQVRARSSSPHSGQSHLDGQRCPLGLKLWASYWRVVCDVMRSLSRRKLLEDATLPSKRLVPSRYASDARAGPARDGG